MKSLPVKWQNIKLNRTTPTVYPRYYRRHHAFVSLNSGHHFYIDDKYNSGEVFYEKIADGFWLLALEMQAKSNNRYILGAKNDFVSYFSVNVFYSPGQIGYGDIEEIHWKNSHVIFFNHLTTSEIYLEKGTGLRCCRLIFTSNYLAGLLNLDSGKESRSGSINIADKFNHILSYRSAIRAEIFLQDRLYDVLRFKRKSYHYRPSLFSILFELTAFFLNTLSLKSILTVFHLRIKIMPC